MRPAPSLERPRPKSRRPVRKTRPPANETAPDSEPSHDGTLQRKHTSHVHEPCEARRGAAEWRLGVNGGQCCPVFPRAAHSAARSRGVAARVNGGQAAPFLKEHSCRTRRQTTSASTPSVSLRWTPCRKRTRVIRAAARSGGVCLHALDAASQVRSARSALAGPRPLHPVGGARLGLALRASLPHRLRRLARRSEVVPPTRQ